jgi:hypothetical protein
MQNCQSSVLRSFAHPYVWQTWPFLSCIILVYFKKKCISVEMHVSDSVEMQPTVSFTKLGNPLRALQSLLGLLLIFRIPLTVKESIVTTCKQTRSKKC